MDIIFKNVETGKNFAFTRFLRAVVGDQADHSALRPNTPYVSKSRKPRHPEREVVPGVPPPPASAVNWVTKLPLAEIPKDFISVLNSDMKPYEIVEQLKATKLPLVLSSGAHLKHFQALLWIEEFAMQYVFPLNSMGSFS